ncbi:hypothetical protein [Metabacillus litoralis]|uniref:hypothetical protein n=1 Tax=Metabacillus litoralis TaxID=152268 RepID=UPI001CFD03B9|nr:hypothetical protein [Metabacillus litoralis]
MVIKFYHSRGCPKVEQPSFYTQTTHDRKMLVDSIFLKGKAMLKINVDFWHFVDRSARHEPST